MSGCGHEGIAPDCIFCGTDGMSAEDIIKGQEAFDLKMRKAKAWDELIDFMQDRQGQPMWLAMERMSELEAKP